MIGLIGVLAANTLRELVRSKLLYNLLIFAVLLIAGSMFVAQLTIGDWDRIILDMGLSAVEGVGVLIAVLIGVSLVAGEIERRTIFPILAKPVGRGQFILGRYAGLLAILAVNVLVMVCVLALVLRLAGYGASGTALAAAGLIFVELSVIAAFALFFASFTTPVLASAFSLSMFLIGHLLADVKAFGARSKSEAARLFTNVIYYLLPDLELFNLKSQAANRMGFDSHFALSSAAYGAAYAAVLLVLAIAIFRQRDLK